MIRKLPLPHVIFLCLGLAPWVSSSGATGPAAANLVAVEKVRYYVQTSGNAILPDPVTAFGFAASSPVAAVVTPPVGPNVTLAMISGAVQYTFTARYGTGGALDAAFPDGSYAIAASGVPAFSLNLAGGLYPNAPQVTNGSWNASGQLVIDPARDTTLQLSAFSDYGTTGVLSHMQLQILQYNYAALTMPVALAQSYITPTNPSAFTTFTIHAGQLQPGSLYRFRLRFDTGTAENTTAIAGNSAAVFYSCETSITVVTSGAAASQPQITQQPASQQAAPGSAVTFNLAATGTGKLLAQWFKNGAPIANEAGTTTLVLNNVQSASAGTYYVVVVDGNGGYVQSNAVTLAIAPPVPTAPTLSAQPTAATVATGATAVFTVQAAGSPAPTYQWSFNGMRLSNGGSIAGADGPALVVTGATAVNAGSYACTVVNSAGAVASSPASLSVVTTNDPGRLINISSRSQVGTGGNLLSAGFVIGGGGGSGSDPVLIRASGPALAPFGVVGVLPDPTLQLYSGASLIAANSGWAGDSQIALTASTVGAFAWPVPTSHDSALLIAPSAGAYSAVISGAANDTGVALIEVYDARPSGTYGSASPRLINISSRARAGGSSNALIAGFVIGGATSKTVLIRASGPALLPFGVAGTLPDPQLQLYSGSTILAVNNGWAGGAAIATIGARVGAFPWNYAASADSALLVTLAPGAYSAVVSGASNDTGVALVEVYDVP